MLFDAKGCQINPNLTNYIMSISFDMSEIDVDIVDNYDPTSLFGARGIGEPTCVSTATAILNVINNAVDVRIASLPTIVERVFVTIKTKRSKESNLVTAD